MRPSCCGRALRWRPHNTCTKAWDTSERLKGTAFLGAGSSSRSGSPCSPMGAQLGPRTGPRLNSTGVLVPGSRPQSRPSALAINGSRSAIHADYQDKVGATGFEPATFRPPAECATSVDGCCLRWFPHSYAVRGGPSCPQFRADCALECAPEGDEDLIRLAGPQQCHLHAGATSRAIAGRSAALHGKQRLRQVAGYCASDVAGEHRGAE
jgi:hypothetical protein